MATTLSAALRRGVRPLKEGLPQEAFAIVGDPQNPATWKLPHHTRAIFRALRGSLEVEKTVDWSRLTAAVAALSASGFRGRRVAATPQEILAAARHLAAHYRAAGRELPPTLEGILG